MPSAALTRARDYSRRILVVARQKAEGVSPFVQEQVDALRQMGVNVDVYPVRGGGIMAYSGVPRYIAGLPPEHIPDVVHAHFGVCGLAATLQRRVPVVVTYHGSDVNDPRIRPFSRMAARRAAANIVVSNELAARASFRRRPHVIPCGVNLDMFYPEDHAQARTNLGFGDEKVVVFAASRERWVKNFDLAERSMRALRVPARLVELRDLPRPGVRTLLSAADVLLMTSRSEGSPQVIKEALATGCPIVSTDVGDVRSMIEGLEHCHVVAPDASAIVAALMNIPPGARVSSDDRLAMLSLPAVAHRVADVYEKVISEKRVVV